MTQLPQLTEPRNVLPFGDLLLPTQYSRLLRDNADSIQFNISIYNEYYIVTRVESRWTTLDHRAHWGA